MSVLVQTFFLLSSCIAAAACVTDSQGYQSSLQSSTQQEALDKKKFFVGITVDSKYVHAFNITAYIANIAAAGSEDKPPELPQFILNKTIPVNVTIA